MCLFAISFFYPTILSAFTPIHHHAVNEQNSIIRGTSSFPSSSQKTKLLGSTSKNPGDVKEKDVWILEDEDDVAAIVHEIVRDAARRAIAERGHFALAIPGGSVLKILSSLDVDGEDEEDDDSDWIPKTTLAYVNHKCVPNDDKYNAIHAKARNMFLDRWGLTDVITLSGADDNANTEAEEYEKKLNAISTDKLPRITGTGFPKFDLCLIGVGDDGHIGSLYPNRDEIDVDDKWTVGVSMKDPPSISLTLPVMQAADLTVVIAAGKSPKYPNGKSAAMKLAIEDPDITPKEFPDRKSVV